ncbi:Poly [ADP-ribose] polymerase 4 [Trichoplax sp. H2]|nr:Poly [ADP-ribose] polymerase 4 [Trichoplax sp. H2]|eukprot:RDD38355.1 Poly [ADP-ribose] polymerase 4 [Trichoplax sp. H2]
MGIFSNYTFALQLSYSLPFKKKQEIRRLITNHDGTISYIINRKTHFLVVDQNEDYLDSYKGRTADKLAIPVVSVDFIHACNEKQAFLNHQEFLVSVKLSPELFAQGKVVVPKVSFQEKSKYSAFDLNKIPVWTDNDRHNDTFQSRYKVLKLVLLKNDSGSKEKKFAGIELQQGETENLSFRVYVHRKIIKYEKEDENINLRNAHCQEIKEYRYCPNLDQAIQLYSHLYNLHTKSPYHMQKCWTRLPICIGSERANEVLNYFQSETTDTILSEDVASLTQYLWAEAVGELDEILSSSVEEITNENIASAEGILLKLKTCLSENRYDQISNLSQQFYSLIPHKNDDITIDSFRLISDKQDLCQLIRDIINVSELTDWKMDSSINAKYKALKCDIQNLEENSHEFKSIKNYTLSSWKGEPTTIKINRIFSLSRQSEERLFTLDIGNKKLLFHASHVANFVGILSRGLLMPRIVVSSHGGKRSDVGHLGSGIYFADSLNTSLQFTDVGKMSGNRMMIISEVALGKSKEYTNKQTELKSPPQGYDSVIGIAETEQQSSMYKAILAIYENNEYAIFDEKQQKLRYLVEFNLASDPKTTSTLKLNYPETLQEQPAPSHLFLDNSAEIDITKLLNGTAKRVSEAGLKTSNDISIPLTDVHFRAKLLDLAAEVVVLQCYFNKSSQPIEAKYVFPLDDRAAVCGFEAFINNKHIIGQVKEKEKAHKEYEAAVARKDGAYLMDEESPDIFTVSVGNLPPNSKVLIKITYVTELSMEGDCFDFFLPSNLAPWKKQEALSNVTQDAVSTVKINEVKSVNATVQVRVEMPFEIRSISSPTHQIRQKTTATKAVVETGQMTKFDDGFRLLIRLAEIHVPRMWVEKYPDTDSQACMLTFYPEFDVTENPRPEIIIALDMSNSMKQCLMDTQKIAALILTNLPPECRFNIVVFGSAHNELFPMHQEVSKESVNMAIKFIGSLSASWGNSNFYHVIDNFTHIVKELKANSVSNVFLISDGHFGDENSITAILRRDKIDNLRLFTFSTGDTSNRYFMRTLAKIGAGYHEHFDTKFRSKWQQKIQNQIYKASQPTLTSVAVHWQQFDDNPQQLMQAPADIVSLFNGSRQVIYGFVSNCTQATLEASIGEIQISTVVSTSELCITTGRILHQLTARALIRDYDDGVYNIKRTTHEAFKIDRKEDIIKISQRYSIVSPFTSFVAIEDRSQDQSDRRESFDLSKLIRLEDIDDLSYVGWSGKTEDDNKDGMISGKKSGIGDSRQSSRTRENVIRCYTPSSFPSSCASTSSDEFSTNSESNYSIISETELPEFSDPEVTIDVINKDAEEEDEIEEEEAAYCCGIDEDEENDDDLCNEYILEAKEDECEPEICMAFSSKAIDDSEEGEMLALPKKKEFYAAAGKHFKIIPTMKKKALSKKKMDRRTEKVLEDQFRNFFDPSTSSKHLSTRTPEKLERAIVGSSENFSMEEQTYTAEIKDERTQKLSIGMKQTRGALDSSIEAISSFNSNSPRTAQDGLQAGKLIRKFRSLATLRRMEESTIPPPPSSLGPTPTLRSQHFRISKSRIASGPPPAQASQPCPPPPLPGSSASELSPPRSYSQSKTNEELLVQQIQKPKPSSSIEINKHKAKIEYQYASINGAKEDIAEIEPNRAANLGSLATSAKALKGFLRVGRQTNGFLSRTNFNSLGASADDYSNLAKEETLDDDKKVEYRQMKFRNSKALAKTYKSANTKDNLVDEPENPKEMKNLTYINCRELMMFQVLDGYWEVTPEIAAIIRISVEKLFRLLTEAGIYSLGSKACKDIVRMVFTKIVIVILGKIAQLQESLARATKWLVFMDKKYPSLLYRFELGSNWECVARKCQL